MSRVSLAKIIARMKFQDITCVKHDVILLDTKFQALDVSYMT